MDKYARSFGVTMNFLRKWLKSADGTTAIEFALLAAPFFTVIMGIIEMSIMFATASILEGGTNTAARLIRTGQIQQTTSDPEAQEELFREAFCEHAAILVNCADVDIEVINIGDFGSFDDFEPEFDEDGNMASQGFDAGSVSDYMLVRTGYRYNLMTPLIGSLLGEGGTNTRYFMSTIVLQTEPYEFVGEEE